jgi:hypothetical protein
MTANWIFPVTSFRIIFTIAMLGILGGCSNSQQPSDTVVNAAHRFTAVSRVSPEFQPQAQQSLIWRGDLIVEDQQSTSKITDENRQFIKQVIERQLRLRNYRFTQDPETADYVLGAALLLDNSPESKNIENFLRLHPMVGETRGSYPRGTLMVALLEPGEISQQSVLWRGAIQAFNMGESLPSEMNRVRIEAFIKKLIEAAPLAR